MISQALVDYYRCPGIYADLHLVGALSDEKKSHTHPGASNLIPVYESFDTSMQI
jgi:hypothetical protein